jgi:hypothetical protein
MGADGLALLADGCPGAGDFCVAQPAPNNTAQTHPATFRMATSKNLPQRIVKRRVNSNG